MKCPACGTNWKYKDGMTCRCGYRFSLNPKEPPFVSDATLHHLDTRLSEDGTMYFTYNQLYVQLYGLLRRKKHRERILFTVLLAAAALFAVGALAAITGGSVLPVMAALALIAGIFWFARRPIQIPHDQIVRKLQTYTAAHPMKNLVDGTRFEAASPNGFEADLLQFAPERILIVDRNDVADMLLLNRFHFEQKTLVVSARKYPAHAFYACQQILLQHPDVPVMLMHDASREGYRMQRKLLDDPSWNLQNQHVQDLGLHPWDVDKVRRPVWIPPDAGGLSAKIGRSPGGSAAENIQQGFFVPVDGAPPRALTGMMGLALVTGLALLSEDLAAHQLQNSIGGDSSWGGCGGDFG